MHVLLKILAESSGGNSRVQEKALKALECVVAGHYRMQMTLHDLMTRVQIQANSHLTDSKLWQDDMKGLKENAKKLEDRSTPEGSGPLTDDCPTVTMRLTRQIGGTCSCYAAVRSFNHR